MTRAQTNKGPYGQDLGATRGIRHMVCHEALALGANVDNLYIPLVHLQAHLANPGVPLPMLVEPCLSDPVIGSAISRWLDRNLVG